MNTTLTIRNLDGAVEAHLGRDIGGIILGLLVAGVCIGSCFADMDGLMLVRGPSFSFLKVFAVLVATFSLIIAGRKLVGR